MEGHPPCSMRQECRGSADELQVTQLLGGVRTRTGPCLGGTPTRGGCWQVLSPEPQEPGGVHAAPQGPWAGGGGWPAHRPPLPGPAGGGVMCHGHCQVARSQGSRAVMSGEGSGWAEGQERLPLRLLQAAAPFLSPSPLEGAFLTSLRAGRPPRLPRGGPRPPAFTSHAPCTPLAPWGGFP